MASAVDSESEFKCAICSQRYQEPRKLPGCSHSFCEYCILTFVQNLKKENKFEAEQEFECPVCRLPSGIPDDGEITIKWVREMDKDSELCGKVKAEDLDNTTKWCAPCKSSLKKAVTPDFYCVICQESFCKPCSKIVHSLKKNNDHSMIDMANPQFNNSLEQTLAMFNRFITCSQHPEKTVTHKCEHHYQLLCVSCAIEKHRMCRNLKEISEMADQLSEDESAKVERTVSDWKKLIQTFIGTIKETDDDNKNKLGFIRDKIQALKQKVVQILDAMEGKLMEDGRALVKEITIKHLDDTQELSSEIKTLEQIQCFITNLIPKLTPNQVYICLHELKCTIHCMERKLKENWSTRKVLAIELKTTDILHSILNKGLNEISQLGYVDQTEEVVTTCMSFFENPVSPRKIKVKKQIVYSILPPSMPDTVPTYNCVIFLPNNGMFIVDSYYGFCCLTNAVKDPIGTCRLIKSTSSLEYFSSLQYATYMACDLIAVSIPDEKKIHFLMSDTKLTSKMVIALKYRPKSIHGLQNNDIAVCWDGPIAFGILRCQLNTFSEKVYFTQDKTGRKFKSFENMGIDEGRQHVVQPCTVDRAVYCFDFEGQLIFKYAENDLEDPRGVALDSAGRIYVCDKERGCIHVVSPEGLGIQIIKEGCPENPLAIGFSSDSKSFAVTQYNQPYEAVHFFSLFPEELTT